MIRNISYRYEVLNKNNLKIGDLKVVDGMINCVGNGKIKYSGNFVVNETDFKNLDYNNNRLAPYMVLNGVEYPLGVFLIAGNERIKRRGSIYRKIEAFDLTQVLMEDKVTNRYFAPKGASYRTLVVQLVQSAKIFNVNIPNTDLKLMRDREFELGTSKLDIVNELLKEMNYTSLHTDSKGVIKAKPYVLPQLREIKHQYRVGKNMKIVKDTLIEYVDTFNLPNVYVGVVSNSEQETLTAKYTINDPSNPISTVSRGRNIVEVINVDDIASDEVLEGYIRRIAYERSNSHCILEFETLNEPDHSFDDCVYIEDEKFGVNDKYIETEWSMNLKAGATMTHKVERVVRI